MRMPNERKIILKHELLKAVKDGTLQFQLQQPEIALISSNFIYPF